MGRATGPMRSAPGAGGGLTSKRAVTKGRRSVADRMSAGPRDPGRDEAARRAGVDTAPGEVAAPEGVPDVEEEARLDAEADVAAPALVAPALEAPVLDADVLDADVLDVAVPPARVDPVVVRVAPAPALPVAARLVLARVAGDRVVAADAAAAPVAALAAFAVPAFAVPVLLVPVLLAVAFTAPALVPRAAVALAAFDFTAPRPAASPPAAACRAAPVTRAVAAVDRAEVEPPDPAEAPDLVVVGMARADPAVPAVEDELVAPAAFGLPSAGATVPGDAGAPPITEEPLRVAPVPPAAGVPDVPSRPGPPGGGGAAGDTNVGLTKAPPTVPRRPTPFGRAPFGPAPFLELVLAMERFLPPASQRLLKVIGSLRWVHSLAAGGPSRYRTRQSVGRLVRREPPTAMPIRDGETDMKHPDRLIQDGDKVGAVGLEPLLVGAHRHPEVRGRNRLRQQRGRGLRRPVRDELGDDRAPARETQRRMRLQGRRAQDQRHAATQPGAFGGRIGVEVKNRPAQRGQHRFVRRGGGECRAHDLEVRVEVSPGEIVLGREIPEDGAPAYARLAGDVVDRRLLKTSLGEHPQRQVLEF
ncbi:hypothetical protein FRACA_120002 [Frankia canadensis]|uniref:Uncharacterized protein n=1 Tax=Frankia canadensis TaxID=1836972 RepID=A0A2I2KJU1_9ACTN|nr:hypothetical protein FRACA_120002 [Frankia canadensis]SOU53229.1 hypothetical protein FRACA_120002 [Frankia canadensis]